MLAYGANSSAAPSPSNLWYDSVNNQLFINTGTAFTLIGPEKAPGFNPTRFISVTLLDTEDTTHPVIEALVDDQVVYVVSGTEFFTSSTNVISGISHIRKGITLKNGDIANSADASVIGTSLYATNANTLLNSAHTGYIQAEFIPTPGVASIVQRNEDGDIFGSTVHVTGIIPKVQKGTLYGNWGVGGNLTPVTNGASNLGIPSLRWNNVYTQSVDTTGLNATGINFATLTDSGSLTINKFDNDVTLAADSSLRLPTQQAVKRYVDSKVFGVEHEVGNLPDISVVATANTLAKRDASGGIFANQATANSLKLASSTQVVNYIDTDVGLTANSDSRFATQRALKQYIDNIVTTEIANRLAGDANLQSQITGLQSIPAGMVFYTASATAPAGYLEAAGQTVTKAAYPALYAAIGGTYGSSSTTFNLPDLRGQFVRGWDHGRGVDAGRTLGSTQADDFKSHQHIGGWGEAWAGPFGQTGEAGHTGSAKTDNDNYLWNTNFVGGSETRPKNIALMAIIKY